MLNSFENKESQLKKILILGAGRSSTYLIEYLAEQAPESWLASDCR
jgi:hypothetical protein